MIPSPDSTDYYVLIWSNGVSSVHRNQEEAILHVQGLRGEGDRPLYPRRPERTETWRKAIATIIHVQPLDKFVLEPAAP